ncbi:DUF4190 domain-containing protein [Mariniluteicoccus flavus]
MSTSPWSRPDHHDPYASPQPSYGPGPQQAANDEPVGYVDAQGNIARGPATPGPGPQPYPQHHPPYAGQFGVPMMPKHPNAVMVLVLGIVGFVAFPIVAPVAWVMGHQARSQMRAQPGRWADGSEVTIGWILGILATIGWTLLLLVYVVLVVVAVAVSSS